MNRKLYRASINPLIATDVKYAEPVTLPPSDQRIDPSQLKVNRQGDMPSEIDHLGLELTPRLRCWTRDKKPMIAVIPWIKINATSTKHEEYRPLLVRPLTKNARVSPWLQLLNDLCYVRLARSQSH